MKVVCDRYIKAYAPPIEEYTPLSVTDTTALAIATCRAMFWNGRLDLQALEEAIGTLAHDLPMLAGRCVNI